MKREDFESLAANQGWQALRQFLIDWRTQLVEAMAEAKAPYPESAHKAMILKDVAYLEWRDVATFYGLWTDEDEEQYRGAQQ